jgi:hypothetical protein
MQIHGNWVRQFRHIWDVQYYSYDPCRVAQSPNHCTQLLAGVSRAK